MRYTMLYGVLFLISGTGLLGLFAAVSPRRLSPSPLLPASESGRGVFWAAFVALTVMLLVSLVLGRAAAGRVLKPLRTIACAPPTPAACRCTRRPASPAS
jgi:hypothetical protein